MNSISEMFSLILPFLYIIIIYFYGFIYFRRNRNLESKTNIALLILIVVHFSFLIYRSFTLENIPLSSKADAFSFLALMIVVFNFIVELFTDSKVTGFFALIIAFLIQLASSILYHWNPTNILLLNNPMFIIHILLSILGYTAICVSALYALLYILLNHNIKNHQFGIIYEKLPSLNLLEKISIISVVIGIVLMGLGIILGHVNAGITFGTFFPTDLKVIFSDIIWIGYFIGFVISQLNKWRGRWMAYLSIVGFIIFILINIITSVFTITFHQFL